MPYKLRKAPKRDLYWVVGDDGKKHSKEPLPRERAEAQMRALYAAMRKEGGGREDMLRMRLGELLRDEDALLGREADIGFRLNNIWNAEGQARAIGDEEEIQRLAALEAPLQALLIQTIERIDEIRLRIRDLQAQISQSLPMDRSGGGTHRENFLKANKLEEKSYNLKELAKISDVPLKKLQEVYNRGIGAYKTNPSSVRMKGTFKKGVNAPMSRKLSKEQWAMARVYSFLDGNPKHDNDLRGGARNLDALRAEIERLRELREQVIQFMGIDGWAGSVAEKQLQDAERMLEYMSRSGTLEGGAWYDVFNPERIVNEVVNPNSIVRQRISDVFKGIRINLPPSARRTLEQYGNEIIKSLMIRRDPIQSALNYAFELITLGQWSKAKSAEHYDDLFHLGLVLTLASGKQILIEKNEVIYIGNPKPIQSDSQVLDLPPLPAQTTLNEFITKGVSIKGNDFYRYDPFKNNCQDFVAVLLRANNAYSSEAEKFVKQPVENLLKQLPSWTQPIARGITDTGAIANVALEGAGHATFTSQLRKAGITPSVYLENARKKAEKAGYGKASELLGFATDGIHKLAIPNEEGKLITFGRVGYGDSLIWTHLEEAGKTPHGSAEKKRKNYRSRAEKIRGEWKKNPFSPNNLAIKILW